MSIAFNADEVFEMAEQIERNAAKFYREAATNAPERQIKDMFLRLAAMEDSHLRTFQQMRTAQRSGERRNNVRPRGQASLYLQAMADDRGSRA
jgi:rubrerythrin